MISFFTNNKCKSIYFYIDVIIFNNSSYYQIKFEDVNLCVLYQILLIIGLDI